MGEIPRVFRKFVAMEEFFNTVIQEYTRTNAYGRLNGMILKEASDGHCLYEMKVTEDHLATPIAAHGGSLAAFMDGILGVTALSVSSKSKRLVSTVEFKINYLNPALLGDVLTGKGEVLRAGKRLIITQGEIRNQKNEIVAIANGTFNAYPYQKSGMRI